MGERIFGPAPVAVAHRGGAGHPSNVGIENTCPAFQNAAGLGYVSMETDVHLTRDGHLVAVHDADLARVGDSTVQIASATLEEVRRVRVGGRARVPTALELLYAFPEASFIIDLKAPGTAWALWRALAVAGAESRVCVGSFSARRMWAFRVLTRGSVATSAGRAGILWLRMAPAWLTRWFHSPAVVYQVPSTRTVAGRRVVVVTPEFVEAAHRIGAQVHVWTVDDPAQMHHLLDLGVDGLISDRTDLLAEVLTARQAWPPTPLSRWSPDSRSTVGREGHAESADETVSCGGEECVPQQ